MDVAPEITPEANPVGLTLATAGLVEIQVTNVVILELIPPLNVPVAVNCSCVPALMDAAGGVTVMADNPDSVPVPLKAADCGLFVALSTTVSVPVRSPNAVGVKVMKTVQVPSFGRVLGRTGQLLVCAKSPVTEIEEKDAAMPPSRFVNVMLCAALVVFTT